MKPALLYHLRSRKVIAVLFVLFMHCTRIMAQCTGFPAVTADADCAGGSTLSNNANINSGQNYGFCGPNNTTYTFTGINLSGGTLRICGNANISGNFNSGLIVVSCGATANFTSGITLNSNVGIINYGTITVNGNITYQNSNNYIYNESTKSQMTVSGNIVFPSNNGQNAYLKNNGYLKVNGSFNAYDGGFTCLGDGSRMEVNNMNYIVNCGGPANRFTFGASTGSAILRYTGTAALKAVFTASSNINVYRATGATATLTCSSTWGSAVVTTNAGAVAGPSASQGCSVSTCWTILPVELLYFNGVCTGKSNLLTWATAAETNNASFSIERSLNGVSWTAVQSIKGTGNSSQAMHYQAYDNNAPGVAVFYRLKQSDLDGGYRYSKVIVVSCAISQDFSIYPNPSAGNSMLINGIESAGTHTIHLYNMQGQQVFTAPVSNGSPVTLPALHKGIYMVEVTGNGDTKRARYVQL